jgi:hypothetical protein
MPFSLLEQAKGKGIRATKEGEKWGLLVRRSRKGMLLLM